MRKSIGATYLFCRCDRCGEEAECRQRGPGVRKAEGNLCPKCGSELSFASGLAMIIVAKAIKEGKIQRPDRCELCHKVPGPMSDGRTRIVAHHAYGYDRPLEFWWICDLCNHRLPGYPFHSGQVSMEQARAFLGIGDDELLMTNTFINSL